MSDYQGVLLTRTLEDIVSKCEDIEELKEVCIPLLLTQQEQWKKKINEIVSNSGLTKLEFAAQIGVTRVALSKWCSQGAIPKNRETFIKIGLAANYNLEEMNALLKRYGRYPGLYSKSLSDCVCIYVINHEEKDRYQKYTYILNNIEEKLTLDFNIPKDDLETIEFDKKLSDIKDEDELSTFIEDNTRVFASTYQKLYVYIKTIISDTMVSDCDGRKSIKLLTEVQNNWSSSLKQCVSEINQNKWYPTRNKIISLGLHLGLTHEEIDYLFRIAHMEPLCAKNVFEGVIIYVLENASINGVYEEEDYCKILCDQARDTLEAVEMPEVSHFISELTEKNKDEF